AGARRRAAGGAERMIAEKPETAIAYHEILPGTVAAGESSSRAERICVFAFALLLALGFVSHLAFGFENDEFTHLHQAWCIGQGMAPYRDFYFGHFPLFHFLAAPFFKAATGSPSDVFLAIRLAALAFAIICASALFILARRIMPRESALYSLIAWLTVGAFGLVGLEFRPDWLALAGIFASGAIMHRELTRNSSSSLSRSVGAGLLIGVSSC